MIEKGGIGRCKPRRTSSINKQASSTPSIIKDICLRDYKVAGIR